MVPPDGWLWDVIGCSFAARDVILVLFGLRMISRDDLRSLMFESRRNTVDLQKRKADLVKNNFTWLLTLSTTRQCCKLAPRVFLPFSEIPKSHDFLRCCVLTMRLSQLSKNSIMLSMVKHVLELHNRSKLDYSIRHAESTFSEWSIGKNCSSIDSIERTWNSTIRLALQ